MLSILKKNENKWTNYSFQKLRLYFKNKNKRNLSKAEGNNKGRGKDKWININSRASFKTSIINFWRQYMYTESYNLKGDKNSEYGIFKLWNCTILS